MLGFGQLLAISGLNPEQQELGVHHVKAGQYLLGLIDNILGISRIEVGSTWRCRSNHSRPGW
ncbi:MAG TPA: hypothetical protein VHN80_11105 [Kineosporiaceae bacterium]|nr:hypothetical protein [Kineosporiaceae bacterium]